MLFVTKNMNLILLISLNLYIRLWRLNLSDRVNYHGILIEETKHEVKDDSGKTVRGKTMREYTVTEMKNLEDITYED